jgi:hypothetical protein
MELYDLILDNSGNWSVKGNFLMYKKYVNIPVCFIEDDIFYIFLDSKISNQVLKITQKLMKGKVEFYFTTPEYSNPKMEIDNNKVIYHYLYSYSREKFFYGFRKIGFDLIQNFVYWIEKEKCYDILKENYDEVLKKIVNRKWYDFYTNKDIFECNTEIRDDFSTLFREIQINRIL